MRAILPTLSAILLVWTSATWAASPTTDNPHDAFLHRPQTVSENLVAQSHALFKQVDEDLARYEENLTQGRYKQGTTAEMKRISTTYAKLLEYLRIAEYLLKLQEPAGVDAELRGDELRARAQIVIRGYGDVPGTNRLLSKPTAKKFAETKARQLEPLETRLAQGKPELVQSRYYEVRDEVEQVAVWHDRQTAAEMLGPFLKFEDELVPPLAAARKEQAVTLINELRTKQLAPFDRFLGNVDASVESIGNAGTATWGGQMLAGPELMTAWMVGWRQAHVMSLRAQALAWSLPDDVAAESPDTLAADYAEFHTRMIAACAALITADGERAAAADVPDLYARYLNALANIIPRMSDNSLRQAVEPALAKLLDKSPEFARVADSYQRATSQVLRWRARQAQAWRRSHEMESKALVDLFLEAATAEAMVERKGRDPRIDEQLFSAPTFLEDVSSLTVEKNTTAEQIATDGNANLYKSRLADFCFASAAPLAVPPEEIAELKADLLVTPASPPLSLDAAIAIATAESGDFAAMGGKVRVVEVDALLGRVINLEDDHILPVGALLGDRPKKPLHQLTWRAELVPQWVQHEYFFVLVP